MHCVLLLYGVTVALHGTWLLLDSVAAALELTWRGMVGCSTHGIYGRTWLSERSAIPRPMHGGTIRHNTAKLSCHI
jgi:hypothetical protein